VKQCLRNYFMAVSKGALTKTDLMKLLLFCDNNERRGVDDRLSVDSDEKMGRSKTQ
jgi:hypothetical protein